MIMGLIDYTDYNDQMITAIFSHLARTINHREIAFFRDVNNPKYNTVEPASKEQVERFVEKYIRFQTGAKAVGLIPKEDYFDRVRQACEAIKSAVAIFNNPMSMWKSETFTLNAVVAWTYLLHAFFIKNQVSYYYVDAEGNPELIDGRPKLWELSKCLSHNSVNLHEATKKNLEYIIRIRNSVAHESSDSLKQFLEPKFQSCALNFNAAVCDWFGKQFDMSNDLSIAIMFAELDMRRQRRVPNLDELPGIIRSANLALEADMTPELYNDSRYSFRVHVAPKTINNKNKADLLVHYAPQGSAIEMAIREVERPKYRPSDIVRIARTAGHNVNMRTFVQFWQSVEHSRNPERHYGVEISGQWYWYEKMLDAFMANLN